MHFQNQNYWAHLNSPVHSLFMDIVRVYPLTQNWAPCLTLRPIHICAKYLYNTYM